MYGYWLQVVADLVPVSEATNSNLNLFTRSLYTVAVILVILHSAVIVSPCVIVAQRQIRVTLVPSYVL